MNNKTTTSTPMPANIHPACRVEAPSEDGARRVKALSEDGASLIHDIAATHPSTDGRLHLSIIQQPVATLETRTVEDQHPAPPAPSLGQTDLTCSASAGRAAHHRVRNGKIACLPKLERDMVNRMLHNNLPHAKIVAALDELDLNVTERNVSNWKTRGGYKEWCAEQERQINLSRLQDNLVDYLRKNDATQLPEVGLQVASTQLSLVLLQPDTARQLAAEPEKYRHVVEMLCRLSTHIQALQKDRNESVKKAGIRDTSEFIKREDEKEIESLRRTYTSKIGKSARERNIPHRNELPKRDELPFREPRPMGPNIMELLAQISGTGRNLPALPAPQPKPAGNPTHEKSAVA